MQNSHFKSQTGNFKNILCLLPSVSGPLPLSPQVRVCSLLQPGTRWERLLMGVQGLSGSERQKPLFLVDGLYSLSEGERALLTATDTVVLIPGALGSPDKFLKHNYARSLF